MKIYKYQIPSSIQNGLNTNRIIERKEEKRKEKRGEEKNGKKVIVS